MPPWKPLAIQDLFQLKEGGLFVVYYAKDDDPRDVRMDYETHIVVENDGRTLTSTPLTEAEAASSSPVGTTLLVHEVLKDAVFVESWDREEALGEKANAVDTSRGLAYFYYHRAELSKTTPKKDPTLWEHLDEEDGL